MTSWTSVRDALTGFGLPMLANAVLPGSGEAITALEGMLGMAKGSATPDNVLAALGSPDAVIKLHQIEADLAKEELNQAQAQIEAVNKTIQTEQQGGSWLQRNHHAIECLWLYALSTTIFVIMPVLKIAVPAIDPTVWLMLGGVTGVTAWQRGRTNQIIASQQGN